MQGNGKGGACQVTESRDELIRDIESKGEEIATLLRRLDSFIDEQHQHAKAAHDVDEMQRLQDADPFRWFAAARHELQSGFMFMKRAAEQPTSF